MLLNVIMLFSAMDGRFGDHQGGKTVPESWSLEREGRERVSCL